LRFGASGRYNETTEEEEATVSFRSKPILFASLLACVLACGCRRHQRSEYVTRAEMLELLNAQSRTIADMKVAAALVQVARMQKDMQARVKELGRRALTAKTVEERTKAVIAACDLDVSELAKTLQGISRAVDLTCNDLANLNTTAYRARRVHFRDSGRRLILRWDTKPGTPLPTERSLDLLIVGSSFFQVRVKSGETAYTRDGSFHVDGNRQLVTVDGYPLLPKMEVPPDAIDVSVGADGTVYAIFADRKPKEIGRIQLAQFADPGSLGGNGRLFKATEASGPAQLGTPGQGQFKRIQSGFLENCNVRAAETLIRLTILARWWEGVYAAATQVYDARDATKRKSHDQTEPPRHQGTKN